MRTIKNRIIAVVFICIVVVAGILYFYHNNKKNAEEAATSENAGTLSTEMEGEATVTASEFEQAKTDLTFWYDDASYKAYFEQMARDYYAECDVKVDMKYCNTLDYTGDIYDATMEDGAFPDLYLTGGDNLEEVYLYGLAAENTAADAYAGVVADNAVTASTYMGKMIGYPLSYDACLFVYQNGVFETPPTSIQGMIEYVNENNLGEDRDFLLEWDVNDAFYDFPFVSNCVTFQKDQPEVMNVIYDEELRTQDLEYLEGILTFFSIDASTVTEEGIVARFIAGKTLCAFVDTDSLYAMRDYDYSVMEIPALNDTLPAGSCSMTDMVIVNDFSKHTSEAADFAAYLTLTRADDMYESCGHYSVKMSDDADAIETIAYQAYQNAVLVPSSLDAKTFWVNLKEKVAQYF